MCVHNVDAIYNIIEINIEANIILQILEKGFIFQINGTLQWQIKGYSTGQSPVQWHKKGCKAG